MDFISSWHVEERSHGHLLIYGDPNRWFASHVATELHMFHRLSGNNSALVELYIHCCLRGIWLGGGGTVWDIIKIIKERNTNHKQRHNEFGFGYCDTWLLYNAGWIMKSSIFGHFSFDVRKSCISLKMKLSLCLFSPILLIVIFYFYFSISSKSNDDKGNLILLNETKFVFNIIPRGRLV